MDSKFHLVELEKLSDENVNLPPEVLACDQTLFDHNSGFLDCTIKSFHTLKNMISKSSGG